MKSSFNPCTVVEYFLTAALVLGNINQYKQAYVRKGIDWNGPGLCHKI